MDVCSVLFIFILLSHKFRKRHSSLCIALYVLFFLQERGGLFSGILKKSNKTTDEAPAQVSDKNGLLLIKVELEM